MLSDYEMVDALESGIAILTEDFNKNVAAMEKEIESIQSACDHEYKISDEENKEFYVCTKCKKKVSCRI